MPVPALPTLTAATTVPADVDLIAVGWTADGPVGLSAELAKTYRRQFKTGVAEVGSALGAGTDLGTVTLLPGVTDGPVLALVGLGTDAPTLEQLRSAAGTLARTVGGRAAQLGRSGGLRLAVSLGPDEPPALRAVAEGVLLGGYRYQPRDPDATISAVHLVTGQGKGATTEVEVARTVAAAVLQAREWINLPPNLLYPASFADDVRALAQTSRLSVEVLDEKTLARQGYGGLLGVGGGSVRPPRLVRLSYAPRGAKAHLALVGKGITFDSGGLNIKTGDGMITMKCDMSGAAAVLATVQAVAALKLKVKVTAYGALAENMPSGSAFRPSDVLTIYGGTTVENGNSDAEGRLVLADGIVRAGEDQPDLIVDVATLTGAAVTALGERTAAVMATDDATSARLLEAAGAAGELLWPMPLPDEIRPKLESTVADLRSTGTDRAGGALLAATFLREFVPEGTAWAHLDIAGPAFHTGKGYGYVTPGGTGYGVRTLVALARQLAG